MAKMKRKQRVMLLVFGGVALAISTILVAMSFDEAISFFYDPTELLAKESAGEIADTRRIRIGGMVVDGSLVRTEGTQVRFAVTDFESEVPVTFVGVLPDLFAEGQGAVAEGYYRSGTFEAETVLAKHDEKYVPREIADSLEKRAAEATN